jgi:hypothetical protein
VILSPIVNEWDLVIPSVADGTRPATNFGTSCTPGNNTYSAYVSILAGASVTDDVFGIAINFNTVGASATARDTICTIGFDAAGGSSFTDAIVDLLCSNAGLYQQSAGGVGGVWYYFPLFIKAGTSIGYKASQNNAAPAAMRCHVVLFCRPRRPELVWAGSYVDTFGSTPASSSGTAFTPGTTSEGAYAQIGSSVASGKNYRYVEFGWGDNSSAQANNITHLDVAVGDATNKRIVVPNGRISSDAGEVVHKPSGQGMYCNLAVGDLLYVRGQSGPNAASTTASAALYAVG